MAVPNDWQALSEPDPEFAQMIQDRFGGTAPGFPGFPDIAKMRALMAKSKRDPSNEELFCRLPCKELDIVCVNVEYRLAPEHPFPAAPNACFDATKWVSQNASTLGIDLSKGFVINGTSAGGNLTFTVCYQWHDEGLQPPITGCHLMNGHFVDPQHVPERAKPSYQSWWELADAPILNHRYSEVFIGRYFPEKSKRGDPLFIMMRREDGPKILPAAYFQIGGLDPVRDEALIFESWIREAGTPNKLILYPGLPHGFWSVFPTIKSSERFFKDAIDGARWLLRK